MAEPDTVIALGKALVELLEQGGQEDVTAHWMAHHLAEQMERARTATEPERQQAQKEAAALILDLWRHRTYLPGRYPLANFEPIMRTLERLSGTAPWHRLPPRPFPNDEADDQVHQWLKRAEAINDASRQAVRSCLDQAIAAAAENEGKWLDILKDLPPLEGDAPTIILRLIGLQNDDKSEANTFAREACAALDMLRQELGASMELRKDNFQPHESSQSSPCEPEE